MAQPLQGFMWFTQHMPNSTQAQAF